MRLLTAIVALGLLLAVTVPAEALSFNQPYNGPIKFKLENADMGTLYTGLADGVYGGGLAGAGVAALDALSLPANQAPGAKPTGLFGNGIEDTWGIARITEIRTDPAVGSSVLLWDAGTASTELTVLFYGAQDYWLRQQDGGTSQRIEGVGFKFDLYEDPAKDYAPNGVIGRTGNTTYTSVTNGTLILSAASVGGHINVSPVIRGGGTSEFAVDIANPLTGVGHGAAYLEVTGGTMAANFNTDSFAPLIAGYPTADISLEWTTSIPGTGGFMLKSEDPARTNFVPEPMTMLGLFLAVGGVGGYIRRRMA